MSLNINNALISVFNLSIYGKTICGKSDEEVVLIIESNYGYTKGKVIDFEKYGILRKIDDSYDNLQLVVEEDGEKTFLTLRRQEK